MLLLPPGIGEAKLAHHYRRPPPGSVLIPNHRYAPNLWCYVPRFGDPDVWKDLTGRQGDTELTSGAWDWRSDKDHGRVASTTTAGNMKLPAEITFSGEFTIATLLYFNEATPNFDYIFLAADTTSWFRHQTDTAMRIRCSGVTRSFTNDYSGFGNTWCHLFLRRAADNKVYVRMANETKVVEEENSSQITDDFDIQVLGHAQSHPDIAYSYGWDHHIGDGAAPVLEHDPYLMFRQPGRTLVMIGDVVAAGGAMSGSAAGAATVTGTLTAKGALAGAAAGAATGAGTLTGDGALAGAAAGQATVDGTLTTAGANLAGSAAGQATVAGTLTAKGALAGSAAGQATATATVSGAGALAGAAAGVATATATLVGMGALAGTAAGTSTATLQVPGVSIQATLRYSTGNAVLRFNVSDAVVRYTTANAQLNYQRREAT